MYLLCVWLAFLRSIAITLRPCSEHGFQVHVIYFPAINSSLDCHIYIYIYFCRSEWHQCCKIKTMPEEWKLKHSSFREHSWKFVNPYCQAPGASRGSTLLTWNTRLSAQALPKYYEKPVSNLNKLKYNRHWMGKKNLWQISIKLLGQYNLLKQPTNCDLTKYGWS